MSAAESGGWQVDEQLKIDAADDLETAWTDRSPGVVIDKQGTLNQHLLRRMRNLHDLIECFFRGESLNVAQPQILHAVLLAIHPDDPSIHPTGTRAEDLLADHKADVAWAVGVLMRVHGGYPRNIGGTVMKDGNTRREHVAITLGIPVDDLHDRTEYAKKSNRVLMKLRTAYINYLVEELAKPAVRTTIRNSLTEVTATIARSEPLKSTQRGPRSSTQSQPSGDRAVYTIGDIKSNVYLEWLAGANTSFDSSNLSVTYSPDYVPLPEVIEATRNRVVDEAFQRARAASRSLPHNGPCIRLHAIDLNMTQSGHGPEESQPILELRPTNWFDYMIANQQIDQHLSIHGRDTTIRHEFASFDRLIRERNMSWVQLSNILTTSNVIVTSDNYFVMGHRTKQVDNHPGQYAVIAENFHRWSDEPTVPGDFWSPRRTIEEVRDKSKVIPSDYHPATCPNPFYTILRGMEEEVAFELTDGVSVSDIAILAVAWNMEHFQPHIYATVRVPRSAREVGRLIDANRALLPHENTLYLKRFEPSGELAELLNQPQWAEVSKGAVLRALVHHYGYEETDRKLTRSS